MIHFAVGSTRLVVSHRTLDCTRGSTGHVHATKRRPEMLKMLTVLRAPITNVMLVHVPGIAGVIEQPGELGPGNH